MTVTNKQLRVARAAVGLSIRDVSSALSMSPTTLTKIEGGASALSSNIDKLTRFYRKQGIVFGSDSDLDWIGWPTELSLED